MDDLTKEQERQLHNAVRNIEARKGSASSSNDLLCPPTEEMIDAPRMLIMWLSFDGNQTIESLRVHLDHAGVDYSCWPDWAKEDTGHLTKSGIAELIYTMMVNAA